MKRMAALLGALLLTLAVTAPAVAVKASTYTVATAFCSLDLGPDFREWGNEQTGHWRDVGASQQMFLLDGGAWEDNGWRYFVDEGINWVPNKDGYAAYGKIEVRGSQFGDFDGAMSSTVGTVNATLHGLDDADYAHLRISIIGGSDEDTGLPAMPPTACGGAYPADGYEISMWTLH